MANLYIGVKKGQNGFVGYVTFYSDNGAQWRETTGAIYPTEEEATRNATELRSALIARHNLRVS